MTVSSQGNIFDLRDPILPKFERPPQSLKTLPIIEVEYHMLSIGSGTVKYMRPLQFELAETKRRSCRMLIAPSQEK